jgi:hypothetical protein
MRPAFFRCVSAIRAAQPLGPPQSGLPAIAVTEAVIPNNKNANGRSRTQTCFIGSPLNDGYWTQILSRSRPAFGRLPPAVDGDRTGVQRRVTTGRLRLVVAQE